MKKVALQPSAEALSLVAPEIAWNYCILPLKREDSVLTLVTTEEDFSIELQNELQIILGIELCFIFDNKEHILKALRFYLRNHEPKQSHDNEILSVKNYTDDRFIIDLINEAKKKQCSDVHIEVFESKSKIRFRIDGQLIERYSFEKNEHSSLINQVKIWANLDISEKRLPQDGRILVANKNDNFDLRVSIMPTIYGEKAVLRILGKDANSLNLDDLGMSKEQLTHYNNATNRKHGLIIISGPTGSGKTTTLYGTLKQINKPSQNIITIEDPIEYTLDGINQVQLRENIGLTFSSALRSFLRQDPDIIMVGEIRDEETANLAIRASLTGHLILSTIHTNSAIGVISRLIDLGVNNYLIADSLILTVAQRLIRLLCPSCKRQVDIEIIKNKHKFLEAASIPLAYEPQGCPVCFHTGFKGRKAIYEVIPINADLQSQIKSGNIDPSKSIDCNHYTSLKESALKLFEEGLTSADEIAPIISSHL